MNRCIKLKPIHYMNYKILFKNIFFYSFNFNNIIFMGKNMITCSLRNEIIPEISYLWKI